MARSVTVIGGGVAGLSAGCALADCGYKVLLLERRPYVGGRASSYEHPGTGEVIDNCQHILLGCCTNLIDFYRRLDVQKEIFWSGTIAFLEPGGRRSKLSASSLPAPLHTASSFLGAKCFTVVDKLTIARGILGFMRGAPADSGENFAEWLVRNRQTERTIQRFWHPVLASALNEDPEYISVRYAAKVFREAFLFSAEGGRMGIPRIPLSDLYSRAIQYIQARGGEVRLRTTAEGFEQQGSQWAVRSSGDTFVSDKIVFAIPFEAMEKLLPTLPQNEESEILGRSISQFQHSPITSVHLWFDREITELTHAALLDTTIQWLYNKSKIHGAIHAVAPKEPGSYLELVISASKSLVSMHRQQIVDLAMGELALFFPAVSQAVLLKAAVTKEVRATYSIRPLLDRVRPATQSPWSGVYLAGDWIATGWPSTMESGVRSGYLSAEAVTRDDSDARKFLVPDLPPTGFMRFIS